MMDDKTFTIDLEPKVSRAPNSLLRAKHEFTATEKRIFYLVMDDLNPNLEIASDLFSGNRTVTIYNARRNLGNLNYKEMLEAFDSISTKKIRYVDIKNQEYDSITPFPRVRFKNGTLVITILEDVLPELTDLKKSGYTRYVLNAAMSLSSQHSQRLYEIVSGWKIKKQRYAEWAVTVERLKVWLNVEGVKTYEKYAQFRRGVLDIARIELAKKTEIKFDFEVKEKQGRKIISLLFKVKYAIEQGGNSSESEISNEINDMRIRDCLKFLDDIGINRENLREKILLRLDDFYKWKFDMQMDKFKVTKSASGHLLKTLGLV